MVGPLYNFNLILRFFFPVIDLEMFQSIRTTSAHSTCLVDVAAFHDSIAIVAYLLVGSVSLLNGPDHGRYGEVFQMGKNREGERKFDIAVVGSGLEKINCREIHGV